MASISFGVDNEMSKLPVSHRYRNILGKISKLCANKIWIVGGWLTSERLGRPYFGDIDLVTALDKDCLIVALSEAGLEISNTPVGSIRVSLPDLNHIDISPFASFEGANTILECIEYFNFSVNSIGFNISKCEYTFGQHCLRNIAERSFRVNERFKFSEQRKIPFLKDMDSMQFYYRLNPTDDARTQAFRLFRDTEKQKNCGVEPRQLLREIGNAVRQYLPEGRECWLSRGVVRSALSGGSSYWDDLDVIVNCNKREVFDFYRRLEMPFTLNFYGSPKAVLPDGQRMDVITMNDTENIQSLIYGFAHRCDSVCWSIDREEFYDPFGNIEKIVDCNLELCENFLSKYNTSDRAYFALKSLYLILRHGFEPGDDLISLVNCSFRFGPHHKKNATRLCKELLSCGLEDDSWERYERLDRGSRSSAFRVMNHYLDRRVGGVCQI